MDKLAANFLSVKSKVGNAEVYCVVKSDGYGCGLAAVSGVLERTGSDGYVVADFDEGVALRDMGIRKPVVVLGSVSPCLLGEAIERDLTVSVFNYAYLERIIEKIPKGKKLKIWLKINSGFNRLGFDALDFAKEKVVGLLSSDKLDMAGIFSHLRGTGADVSTCQYRLFLHLVDGIRAHGVGLNAKLSLLNSGGVDYGLPALDIVRTGAALYGLKGNKKENVEAENNPVVAEFYAQILQINTVPSGESLGYDDSFVPQIDTRVAVLDVGYADGLPRRADKKGLFAIINGKRCPFVGSVCMNHSFVALPNGICPVGDAEIFGKNLPVALLANRLETIDYEILCRFGKTAERIYG